MVNAHCRGSETAVSLEWSHPEFLWSQELKGLDFLFSFILELYKYQSDTQPLKSELKRCVFMHIKIWLLSIKIVEKNVAYAFMQKSTYLCFLLEYVLSKNNIAPINS